MKVALDVTPWIEEKPTGVHLIAQAFTEELIRNERGIQFVLTGLVPKALAMVLYNRLQKLGDEVEIRLIPVPARWFHAWGRRWQSLPWPQIELWTGEIDIYHSFDWFHLPSRAVSTSTVYDLTTELFPNWHTLENIHLQEARLRSISTRCDTIFCISETTKRDFLKIFSKIKSTHVEVLYPGIKTSFAKENRRMSNNILEDFQINSGYILAVGTLEPRKNLVCLIDAYDKLPEYLKKKHQLVLVGSMGWKSRRLEKILRENSSIITMGYLDNDQLPNLYRQAHLLAYPSLYEGFGLPILEAMSLGCLVMTSDVSSMPEVVGTAGILVDPESTKSIKNGLERCLSLTLGERENFTTRAKKRARRFSYRKSADEMVRTWQRL